MSRKWTLANHKTLFLILNSLYIFSAFTIDLFHGLKFKWTVIKTCLNFKWTIIKTCLFHLLILFVFRNCTCVNNTSIASATTAKEDTTTTTRLLPRLLTWPTSTWGNTFTEWICLRTEITYFKVLSCFCFVLFFLYFQTI